MAKRGVSRDALLREEIERVSSDLKKGEHDLTTTPYGRRFLEVAKWNNAGSKTILRKYRVGPGQLFIPVSHRAYWLNDDQRRRIGARVLPSRPEGLLHHLPRAEREVLSEPLGLALVAASVVAGLSALFGP